MALAGLLALGACAAEPVEEEQATVSPPAPQLDEKAPEGTMPFATRGLFRATADGAPDPADCTQGETLSIDETGYAIGDASGTIASVETQSRNSIYATFDTQDGEARERFAASDEGRTVRRSTIGPEAETVRYRRCPDA
ncbi:hypothetical protein [Sphingomicrobium aestuariivivum]|uniref:hypothetical protein n=1 Tax=Sphingomicrobium aestuariivivum TaxID=1582356 RepID=UPI001FD6CFB6|nr:hypothetical protein [Sphingomicrobium aestuariivivum]MCJ8191700.1 hypothetical protein [Sphingomicrobium aestuariivivum]